MAVTDTHLPALLLNTVALNAMYKEHANISPLPSVPRTVHGERTLNAQHMLQGRDVSSTMSSECIENTCSRCSIVNKVNMAVGCTKEKMLWKRL